MAKKKVRKKLNVVRTLLFILIIYIIVCSAMYIYKQPVKHYEISGNTYISDADILRAANLENYPPYINFFKNTYKNKIKKLDLVKDVKISYGWNFKIKIKIIENTPLLKNKVNNKIILLDGTEIEDDNYVGLPILLNSTPKAQLIKLLEGLNELKTGIRYMINDIEYAPSYNEEGSSIDENRFLFSMNDKNLVYLTVKKITRLNSYLDIISTNKITVNGTLYLDGDEERYPFKYENVKVTTEEVKTTKKAKKSEN